jgi:hypothetical protein
MFISRKIDSWKDALDQLELWEALHHKLAPDNPFVSPYWSEIWFDIQIKNKQRQVYLLTCTKEGPQGITLLSKGRTNRFKLPVKSIESVGAGASAGDRHFVFKQEPLLTKEAIDPLMARIGAFKHWAFFRLAPLPSPYPFYEAFRKAAGRYGLCAFKRPYSTGYKIRTRMGWEAYEKSRSKKFRKNMRSAGKKMNERNHFRIEEVTGSGSTDYLSGIIHTISMKSWKVDAGTDIFSANYSGFWKIALLKTLATGKSTVWVLFYQDQPVAYEWYLRQGRCIISLKADYDREFTGFSPGNLLSWHALQHAFATGASEIDFLMGGGDYKKRWATDAYQLDELLVFNKSPSSRIWREILSRQDQLKALYQALRPIMSYFK